MPQQSHVVAIDLDARAAAAEGNRKADLAAHRMDSHEEICGVRYAAITAAISDIKNAVNSQGDKYSAGINRVHDRIDAGQKRLIVWLAGTVGTLTVGLAGVVFFIITKGGG